MERLGIKHMFTTIYKPNTNGLVEQTNKTLCLVIVKKTEMKTTTSDWDFKIHHTMWRYNTISKTTTGFSLFRLAYDIEALLSIDFKLMTLCNPQKYN